MTATSNSVPTIPQFFSGKNILITGGTGFIGKVLIWKLLTTCPDIQNIYLLIRTKKNKTIDERLKILTDVVLFDGLRKTNPEAFQKLIGIEGDVQKLRLGLNESDRWNLIENIHIVYHSSASVRFDDDLKDAILSNTRATREISYLALEMKKLELLVDISTSYCHCERKVVDEVLYPAQANWRDAIKMAEEMDSHTMNTLTAKYIEPLPNTYTFSKRLSEQVINDLCVGKIPVTIVRPSIVIPSLKEPFPCWIENFNGPIGICVGVGKGIIRNLVIYPDVLSDYIPVDVVVRGLIAATWQEALKKKDENQKKLLTIYNATNCGTSNLSYKVGIKMGMDIVTEVKPLMNVLWYPSLLQTKCKYYSNLRVIPYQVLPALLIDGMLKLIGQKPRLLKIQQKVYRALLAVQYFMLNQWTFNNDNFRYLDDNLLDTDREEFTSVKLFKSISWYDYMMASVEQTGVLLLNETPTPEKEKNQVMRFKIFSTITNVIYYGFIGWLLLIKIDIVTVVSNNIYSYLEN